MCSLADSTSRAPGGHGTDIAQAMTEKTRTFLSLLTAQDSECTTEESVFRSSETSTLQPPPNQVSEDYLESLLVGIDSSVEAVRWNAGTLDDLVTRMLAAAQMCQQVADELDACRPGVPHLKSITPEKNS